MTDLTILTGASRGLGLALARRLLTADGRLICISRQYNAELAEQADAAGAYVAQWSLDLARGADAAARLAQWLEQQDPGEFTTATLINNAGAITAVRPVRALQPAEVQQALAIGLQAPILLTSAFLHATRGWRGARRVLNISSGLARRPMAAQSLYCAAKAGLDHFTRCLALEEAALAGGAAVCALSPGGIDTAMMAQLRDADPTAFPDHATFVDAKDKGRLQSPDQAARRVLDFLARPEFGRDPIGDVRSLEAAP